MTYLLLFLRTLSNLRNVSHVIWILDCFRLRLWLTRFAYCLSVRSFSIIVRCVSRI